MICENMQNLLGLKCTSLDDDGNIAIIEGAFTFEDGDALPIFVEKTSQYVRFFDDGMTLLHLMGLGINFSDKRKLRFIKNAIEPIGASLTDEGIIEVSKPQNEAKTAFAIYLEAMYAIVAWEKGQTSDIDLSYFIEEVEMYLRAWKTGSEVIIQPKYKGITGHEYTVNFSVQGQAYIVATYHPNSISAALKKLVDIRSAEQNQSLQVTTIIDDRDATESQRKDSMVLQTVGNVLDFSQLKSLAKASQTAH